MLFSDGQKIRRLETYRRFLLKDLMSRVTAKKHYLIHFCEVLTARGLEKNIYLTGRCSCTLTCLMDEGTERKKERKKDRIRFVNKGLLVVGQIRTRVARIQSFTTCMGHTNSILNTCTYTYWNVGDKYVNAYRGRIIFPSLNYG